MYSIVYKFGCHERQYILLWDKIVHFNLFEAVAEYVSYRAETVDLEKAQEKTTLQNHLCQQEIIWINKYFCGILTKCRMRSQGRGKGRRQPPKQPQ